MYRNTTTILIVTGIIILIGGLRISRVATGESKPDDGLVLLYDFEEGEGDVAHDKSGHGNDGKITAGEWKTGEFGKALYLDGKSAMIECPASDSLNTANAGTIELWFNAESLQGALITRDIPSRWEDRRLTLAFMMGDRARILFWALGDGKTSQRGLYAFDTYAEAAALNHWIHVAVTFDGTDFRLYRNGEPVGGENQKVTPDLKDIPLRVGRIPNTGVDPYFQGLVDEIRVYNRALSGEEIADYYKRTASNRVDKK